MYSPEQQITTGGQPQRIIVYGRMREWHYYYSCDYYYDHRARTATNIDLLFFFVISEPICTQM